MADYTPSNTKRLKVLQTGPRGTHHMVFRFPDVQDTTTMISQARAVTQAMLAFCLEGTTWASAEMAPEGSEVFLPGLWGTPQVAGSTSPVTVQDEYGRYLNFVGRSTGGSRVAFYLFNVAKSTGTANNRLSTGESPDVQNVIDAFVDDAINMIAIDQNPFILKGYANSGINDAVAKKSRSLA